MKKYKVVVELGPFEGKKREVITHTRLLFDSLGLERKQFKILEAFSLSVQKAARAGSMFERKFCRELSLWYTKGARDDVFYRTSGSGSRATRRNSSLHQGDVSSLRVEGFELLEKVVIELKGYSQLPLLSFFGLGSGKIRNWWDKLEKIAEKFNKIPWLVLKVRNERTYLNVFPAKINLPSELKKVRNDCVCGVFSNDLFGLEPEVFLRCLESK